MSTYIQRQFSSFLGLGNYTDPTRYGIMSRYWAQQDVVPSKVLVLADGKYTFKEEQISISTGRDCPLPINYDPAKRLFVYFRTNNTATFHIESGSHAISDVVIKAGTTADEFGTASIVDFVTNVSVYNNSSSNIVTFQVFMFEYPDITSPASWRDGYETTGVVTT